MELVLHTGAHFTEEERLVKCLLRNKGEFSRRGVSVPGPGKYRRLLRDTLNALETASPSPDARDILMDAILDDEVADRLVLSHAHFFGVPRTAMRNGFLYPRAVERLRRIAQIFEHDQIEMFMAIRNPASFLPAIFERSPQDEMIGFMGGADPLDVRWSDFLREIRQEVPQISITVWCSEDAPLIWGQIIREIGGLEHGEKVVGGFDLLSSIMSREGMKRFRSYLKEHPVMSEMQRRRVIAAFLDKFALDEEIEEEVDLPGWTDNLVWRMTEIYDEDVFDIQRIPGIQMISP